MIKDSNIRFSVVVSRETFSEIDKVSDYECISKSRLTENLYRMFLDGYFNDYYDEIVTTERW